MKTLLIVLTAVVTLAPAAPATAQVFFGVGPHGAAVRVGPPGYYVPPPPPPYWHTGWWGGCRIIRERIVRPSGRVVYREREVCG